MRWVALLIGLLACCGTTVSQSNSTVNKTLQQSTKNCTNNEDRLNLNCINNELENQESSLAQLFAVTALSGAWIIYLTFFNSRLVGLIVTKIINQFSKDAYISIGSLSVSFLSGKLMFREVVYVDIDYSIRAQDGYVIFRWWRPYNFTKWIKQKDLDQGHTRLSVYISHLEYHLYNRSSEYDRLNDLFGVNTSDKAKEAETETKPPTPNKPAPWRSLFPVIKFTISSGRLIFGNRLLPNTLIASFEDGDIQYKTTEASNSFDLFMHVVEGNFGEFRVTLTPSNDYDPSVTPAMLRITKVHNEPPPRKMGSGYVIAQAKDVNLVYQWDEPGLVPSSSEETPFRDLTSMDFPLWKMHVSCGKRTSLNYGPWADRQRELLWKFFFPPDYQKLKVNEAQQVGDIRVVKAFFFSLNFLRDADVGLFFTKQDKVSALQINASKGSFLEVDLPMLVNADGYSTKVTGQFLNMTCTSTLSYEHFVKAEILSFTLKSHYPLHWNAVQTWDCDLTSTKATCTLLFQHKDFISDLMEDWSNKVPPDLMSFVPYTMKFNINLYELELVLPTNSYNWIDCSARSNENAFVGLYGKHLSINFTLPFTDFLPPTWCIPFRFQLTQGELCVFLPESNPARNVLLSLKSNLNKWNQDKPLNSKSGKAFVEKIRPSAEFDASLGKTQQWGMISGADWVKCWQVPSLELTLTYTWHPIYASCSPTFPGAAPKEMLRTSSVLDSTENLARRNVTSSKQRGRGGVKFDPTTLEPDEIRVDLFMNPGSKVFLYGSLLDLLLIIKENYFGYDDTYTAFSSGDKFGGSTASSESVTSHDNPLYYRPLQVTLDINLCEISGVLPIYPTPALHSPPTATLKKLTFEMDKNYPQTRLQLLLSQLDIKVSDRLNRPHDLGLPLNQGHVSLCDLQLRGHAMFSGNGLPLGATQIEYAWLTEVLVGPVQGRLSVPQTQALLSWAQNLIFLAKNEEHQLIKAFPNRLLPTGITWDHYRKKNGKPAEETDVKYLMLRIRVDSLKLQLAEGSTLLDLDLSPVTLANGNVQEKGVLEAVSVVADNIRLRHRIAKKVKRFEEWLDAGELELGPLIAQVTMATDELELNEMQDDFLKFHDRKTRRLDFLWENADESLIRRTSSGVTSLLDNVRGMKSWGCTFFTPLSTTHPTFFYNRQVTRASTHQSHFVSASDDPLGGVGGADCSEEQSEEEVFDSGMDFGMSLLVRGRRLLMRKSASKEDRRSSRRRRKEEEIAPGEENEKPKESHLPRGKSFKEEDTTDAPFRPQRQKQEDATIVPLKSSFRRKPAGQLLMEDLVAKSQTSDEISEGRKRFSTGSYLKRSTESNLYCSAESDFKSSGSTSSEAFYSAESDMEDEESSRSAASSSIPQFTGDIEAQTTIEPVKDGIAELSDPSADFKSGKLFENEEEAKSDQTGSEVKGGISGQVGIDGRFPRSRPDVLEINHEIRINRVSKHGLKTPSRKCSVRKQTLANSGELLACYEGVLASSKLAPEGDSPGFVETCGGMRPSVILKKEDCDVTLQRRYSMDVLDQSDEEKFNSTNIKLHVKDSVKMQVSPFLLESLHHFTEAAQLWASHRHPYDVINELQRSCVDSAVTSHKVMDSAKQADSPSKDSDGSEVKPGFLVHICVDAVCVNVVQATLGDDPVFNLHINKLLPNPALSLLTLRLDQVEVNLELNSKHDKLVSKMLTRQRKISSTSGKSGDGRTKMPGGKISCESTSSDVDEDDVTVFDFIGHASVDTVGLQLRVLSEEGELPERTSMIAISDRDTRSTIRLDRDKLLPGVVRALERYEGLPTQRQKRTPRPKEWGWVTIEAGCRGLRADIVKQVPAEPGDTPRPETEEQPPSTPATSERKKGEKDKSPDDVNRSPHVHFQDSASVITDDVSGQFDDHVTNGVLNVDLLWLNVVSPLSTSQALKSSRSFRSWNLLTSVAPSVSAWLDPLDRLSCSMERYDKLSQSRKYATVSSALLVALECASRDVEAGSKLWEVRGHKFDALTELATAIRYDPSFQLCDAIQRLMRDPDEAVAIETALADPPALVTMETGFQVVVAQWMEALERRGAEISSKSRKKGTTSDANGRAGKSGGIKYDGNLELSMVIDPTASHANKLDDSGKQPLLTPEPQRRNTSPRQGDSEVKASPAPERHQPERATSRNAAQELVYKQQQSMYSWMQNSADVEAQRDSSGLEHRTNDGATSSALFSFKPVQLTPRSLRFAQVKFESVMRFFGASQVADKEASSNFIKSKCAGSLMLRANLKTLRIDKQNADKLYTREASHRHRRANNSSRSGSRDHLDPAPPILLFQGFNFDASVIDKPVQERTSSSEKADGATSSKTNGGQSMNNNNSNKNDFLDLPSWQTGPGHKSTLNLRIDSSLKQVTQRVDIALVRLVHQFVQCSDAIQQAKTDIQVNKYTEGASSPDPTSIHKRTLSNFTNLSAYSFGETRPPLHRRNFSQNSGLMRFHSTLSDSSSTSSSSTDSEALARCWQILYKLIDIHNTSTFGCAFNATSVKDEFESELDRPRGLSTIARQANVTYESPFVSMLGSATFHIKKTQLLAEFGDLKASVLLTGLEVTLSHTQTSLGRFSKRARSDLRARLAQVRGEVSENLPDKKKTVITCEVASSNLDASTNHKRDSDNGNTCSIVIGLILIDLPQHPASLHDVVSRGSHNLSSHILEFSKTPTYKMSSFDVVDGLPMETPSAATLPPATPLTPSAITAIIDMSQDSSDVNDLPVVISVDARLEGVEATVNLLPSLRVTYHTRALEGCGRSGPDAGFELTLAEHALHFVSELHDDVSNEPVSTRISLPTIGGSGKQMSHKRSQPDISTSEGEFREGKYLLINVMIGSFDHSLTTDLFNQLVFFHEIFMDEVNDVIMKISRGKKPASIRSEASLHSLDSDSGQNFLYQLQVELEEIRLTATTPSSNAVRLKTGKIVFELSNRIPHNSKGKKLKNLSKYLKMFGKAQVDLNLALGTLHVNNVYPEAEPEFHQMAYFNTRLGLQNTSQQSVPSPSTLSPNAKQGREQAQDNNVVLISLNRPIFFVQPTAFDKAILIFLAYKHAYEEWTEKRVSRHGVRQATRQVVSAIQRNKPSTMMGSLFLQLSVSDVGICLPTVSDVSKYALTTQDELSSALVLTVQNTMISACYDRSLVTRGSFRGFCVRFADDFQTSWDDWSPNKTQVNTGPGSKDYVIMNSFLVPDGTYEVCTDTTSHQADGGGMSALTCANVRWQMKGIDVELDTNIGACLAGLVDVLTIITGQDGNLSRDSSASDKLHLGSQSGSLADLDMTSNDDVTDGARDKVSPLLEGGPKERAWSIKERTRKIEQELNEQVRIVNDLRSLGAKSSLIKEQEKQLHALESTLSSMFRQTVRNRLRRSSTKNVDPSKRPTHQRSMSHVINTTEHLPSPKMAQSAFSTLPPGNIRDRWGIPSPSDVFTSDPDLTKADERDDSSDFDSLASDEVDGSGPSRVRRSLYNEDSFNASSHGRPSIAAQQLGGNELEADLELVLDIRVEIDGGKIVCHPKSSPRSEHIVTDRSKPYIGKVEVNKTTTFFVPGVDVKLHYNSHQVAAGSTVMQEFFTPPGTPRTSKAPRVIPHIEVITPGGGGGGAPLEEERGAAPSKRACVYACFSLQSLPEMIISPFLLDFLDQTLTAIPPPSQPPPPRKEVSPYSDDEEATDEASSEGPGAVEVFNTTMASLPVDVVVSVQVQPSQVLFNCQPASRVECLIHIPSLELVFSSIRDTTSPSLAFAFPEKEIPNGLSFSAVMSDFSVYVFHPYGAQQGVDAFDINKQGSGRKDSLSVNLKLVKVNIVRTRKGTSPAPPDPILGGQAEPSKLLINLSVLVDIDKASFKYDMRRLSEVLALPRAWYRKSIARRLFFGDTNQDGADPRSGPSDSNRKDKSGRQDLTPRRPLTPKTSFHSGRSESKSEGKPPVRWRGVVLFNVHMSVFDVDMNMGNVMGVTLWSSNGLRSSGRLCFHSSGEKEIHLSCGLDHSRLSAKSGIIGGDIELRKLHANCNLLDLSASEPHHNACVKMSSLDGRIEYMGSCIMMGRLTSVCLKLGDEWKVEPNKSSVSVFVPGDVGWEDFYLIISRSTTPDVIKMLSKLEEFFTQQFHNSVRALTSLRYTSHADVTFRRQTSTPQVSYAHQRHWPPAYAAISQSPQGVAPAQYHLGGSLCLHGNDLTVVCFHGANFHSHSWVLFNLLQPNIVFSTEAQEIRESMDGNETSILAIQSLTFNLSHDYWLKTGGPLSDPMATVSRVTRRQQNPPPNAAPLDEWFAYVTASRSQELNMLRTLNDMNTSGNTSADSPRNRRTSGNNHQSNYNHDTDIIFALPKLQCDFKTEHMQGPREPDPADTNNRPLVECSFVTEFTDHICVTMDVELIMFLHDLVSSYLKEKQQAFSSRSRLSSVGVHSSVHADGVTLQVDPIDLRNFVCNTWQLEPTVRLISWAGRRIEPVGVDYILQKLGFKHARTTIPKWMQRGVLDVLDQTLAVIVQNLVVQINNQKHKK